MLCKKYIIRCRINVLFVVMILVDPLHLVNFFMDVICPCLVVWRTGPIEVVYNTYQLMSVLYSFNKRKNISIIIEFIKEIIT